MNNIKNNEKKKSKQKKKMWEPVVRAFDSCVIHQQTLVSSLVSSHCHKCGGEDSIESPVHYQKTKTTQCRVCFYFFKASLSGGMCPSCFRCAHCHCFSRFPGVCKFCSHCLFHDEKQLKNNIERYPHVFLAFLLGCNAIFLKSVLNSERGEKHLIREIFDFF